MSTAGARRPLPLPDFSSFRFRRQAHRRRRGKPHVAHGDAAGDDQGAEGEARLAAVEARVREWQPDAVVVGVPFHPDGASHDNTARAKKFARQLRGRLKLPVYEVDERYSTTEALAGGASDPDAGAACVILEQFLRSLP